MKTTETCCSNLLISSDLVNDSATSHFPKSLLFLVFTFSTLKDHHRLVRWSLVRNDFGSIGICIGAHGIYTIKYGSLWQHKICTTCKVLQNQELLVKLSVLNISPEYFSFVQKIQEESTIGAASCDICVCWIRRNRKLLR